MRGLIAGNIIIGLSITVCGIWKTSINVDTTTGDFKASTAIMNPGPVGKTLGVSVEKNKNTDTWEFEGKNGSFVKLGPLTYSSDSGDNPETKLKYVSGEIPIGKNIAAGLTVVETRKDTPVKIANQEWQIFWNNFQAKLNPKIKKIQNPQKPILGFVSKASLVSKV